MKLSKNSKLVALQNETLRFANITALAICGFLWFNFLYEPWPLSWNPLYDILFTRTGGPLLYANHVSSALFMLGTASYFALRDTKHALNWILVIFSGISIHELLLSVISYPVYASSHPAFLQIINNPLTTRWIFWLLAILLSGIALANKFQRKKLAEIAVIIAVYEFAWTWIGLVYFQIDPMTIIQYKAGPAFFSVIPNIFEVTSWFITGAWWFKK